MTCSEANGEKSRTKVLSKSPVQTSRHGKRRYRIEQARAEKFAADANFEDFLRGLRADAARNFV